MNIRDLIDELEQLAHDYGEEKEVKIWLSVETQLIDDFIIEVYDTNEIHISTGETKREFETFDDDVNFQV